MAKLLKIGAGQWYLGLDWGLVNPKVVEGVRVCDQTSQMDVQASCTAARKFLAVLS